MSLQIVYIPVMSSKDLLEVLSAIVEHWELEGDRKAKDQKYNMQQQYRSFVSIQIDKKIYLHTRNDIYRALRNLPSSFGCPCLGLLDVALQAAHWLPFYLKLKPKTKLCQWCQ